MSRYSDDDIRNMKKITCQIAGQYLGISSMAVSLGMRNNLLPIGFAIHNEENDRAYSESWSYNIVGERLIAYKYGRINEIQVENIENNLSVIIEKFEEVKQDIFKRKLNKDIFEVERVNKRGQKVVRLRSSRDLDTEEMTRAIERFRNWSSAVAGLYIPSPNETDALFAAQQQMEQCAEYL